MHSILRRNTTPVKTAATVAAVALVAIAAVVVVPGCLAARVDPAVVYGRWVKNGEACDTERGDMVVAADGFTGHMDGGVILRMRLVSIAPKPPDGLELKLQSYAKPEFVLFVAYTVKDATTVAGEDGTLWRKCP